MLKLIEKDGVIRLEIHAKPRAKKSRILDTARADGSLEIAIAAQPIDGAANVELIAFLSKTLGIPKRSVTIVRGETAHKKLVAIAGITAENIMSALNSDGISSD